MNRPVTTPSGEQAVTANDSGATSLLASKILSYVILLFGMITVILSAYLVVVTYTSLPHWDEWSQIDFAANRSAQSTLDWLWSQHNQHRLVIPRLFLLADLRWFHATQGFLLASIFGIQLLHLLLLSWSMRILGRWQQGLWLTGTGLAAFCLFSPAQWENFTWGFQTCFVLPGMFATLSWIGLLLYWIHSEEELSRGGPWKYLLLSVAAALGASYSLSNGNLLWPLLVGAALLLRLRLAAVLSFVIAGAVSTAVYLNNYYRPASFPQSAETLLQMLKYLTAYFGSSWVSLNVHAAEFIGAAGVAVLLFLLLRLPSYVRDRRPFSIQLVLTLLFCLATGMVTALARMVFGIPQAFSSRYQTVALLFWCCMGLLLLGRAFSLSQTRKADFLWVQALLLAIMLFAAGRVGLPLSRARLQGFQLNVAAVALVANVPDKEQLQWADSQPDYVLSFVPYMRRQRLSVFSGPLASLVDIPLDAAFSLASTDDCAGRLESASPVAGARQPSLRITGWAWDNKHRQAPSEIVATTNGVIRGLGVVGDWRPAVRAANPRVTSNYTGFTGYVGDVQESTPVNIYAILAGRPATVCLIATLPVAPSSAQ
jgi:hypothetical protein